MPTPIACGAVLMGGTFVLVLLPASLMWGVGGGGTLLGPEGTSVPAPPCVGGGGLVVSGAGVSVSSIPLSSWLVCSLCGVGWLWWEVWWVACPGCPGGV